MKIIVAIFMLSVVIALSACDNGEKIIAIADLRPAGLKIYEDTTMAGYKEGDVYINQIIARGERAKAHHDTLNLYEIHFFKTYNGKLKNYLFSVSDTEFYDQASYKWLTETELSVQFIYVLTQEKSRVMNIMKNGTNAVADNRTIDEIKKGIIKSAFGKDAIQYDVTMRFTRPDPPYEDYDTVLTFNFADENQYNAWKESNNKIVQSAVRRK
jgi:hypothetical protein